MKWINNWFSNMKPFDEPMWYKGITYRTVEHFYQSHKFIDKSIQRKISSINPYEAKKYAQTIPLRSDWEDIKISIMYKGLQYKFSKETTWYQQLIKTVDPVTETNNWHDNYWGNCICDKCKNKEGKDILGKLLTKIRDTK